MGVRLNKAVLFMVKMLSIGNSFSQDALAYFRDIAVSAGCEVEVWHLHIGGCSLERHYNNMMADIPEYAFELDGENKGSARLSDVIEKEQFDIVTIQQVSSNAGLYSTYHPYIDAILEYIRKHQPNAKLWWQKTWAYERDSTHSGFAAFCRDQAIMHTAITKVCECITKEVEIDGVIPSGDVIDALRKTPEFNYPQEPSLCRDGFHMHLLYGRYAVAATWFEKLLGGDITKVDYLPPEDKVGVIGDGALHRIEVIKRIVHDICSK